MAPMAPPLRRLTRALLVALATALVCGVLLGTVQASDGQADAAPVVPMPNVGDHWTYQAVLAGHWGIGASDEVQLGQPFTLAEFEWLPSTVVRDADGAEVTVDPLDAHTWFHLELNLPEAGSEYTKNIPQWYRVHDVHSFRHGTTEGLAEDQLVTTRQQQGGIQGSEVAGQPLSAAGQVRQVDGVARFFGGSRHPCLARSDLQGKALDLKHDVDLQLHCVPSYVSDLSMDGGSFHFTSHEAVAGYDAYRFDSDQVSVWLSPQLPVPVRIAAQGHDRSVDITLSSFRAGSSIVGASGPEARPGVAPPLVLAPRQPWGPDDSGVHVVFPASQAYKSAQAAPQFTDLRDWLSAHPAAQDFLLEYAEDLQAMPQQRAWTFGLTDGDSSFGFTVTEQRIAELPLPPTYSYMTQSSESFGTLFGVPPLSDIPDQLPTAASLLARWQSYQETAGDSEQGNGWAYNTFCILGCQYTGPMIKVVAGHDPIAGWLFSTQGGPSAPALQNVTFRGSQVEARPDGTTIGFTHWTGYATSEARVGPLSAHPVVDGQPTPAKGAAPVLASFVPTQGQAAAISLVATLAGLLYYVWPSLKGGSFLGLFSRLTGPKLLEHPARARLVELVQAEPGIHFQDLVRRSGLANGTAAHHLNKLAKAGLLSARPLGRYTCYFPGSSVDRASLAQAPVLRSEGARLVFGLIQANPGLSGLELAGRAGLQPSTVNYHVQKLVECGLVATVRDGRAVRLRAAAA